MCAMCRPWLENLYLWLEHVPLRFSPGGLIFYIFFLSWYHLILSLNPQSDLAHDDLNN